MASLEEFQKNEEQYNCSINELKDFKSSKIWQDMLTFIQEQTKADTIRLVNTLDEKSTLILKGQLQTALKMEELPDLIINILEERKAREDGRE